MERKEEGLDAGKVIDDKDGRGSRKIFAAMHVDADAGQVFEERDGVTGSQISTTVHSLSSPASRGSQRSDKESLAQKSRPVRHQGVDSQRLIMTGVG